MTETSATIIADSISPDGVRLTTLHCIEHRFILPEVNTHRVFSRNTRSSRAVPTKVLLKEVRSRPAMPISWGRNQQGMRAAEELTGHELEVAKAVWLNAAINAARLAETMLDGGVHKQVVNRLIEPFLWSHTLISATDWANFFALRVHPDAQSEMRLLAERIKAAMDASRPHELRPGEWHLPYVTDDEIDAHGGRKDPSGVLRKLSIARCARVSYKPFDGKDSLAAELDRADRILVARPLHASPCEHQASPDLAIVNTPGSNVVWEKPRLHGNFRGWCQFRKMLPGECVFG